MKYSEDVWVEVIKEWLKQNPGKDINAIPVSTTIIYNGVSFDLGNKINALRKRLRNNKRVSSSFLNLGLTGVNSNSNKIPVEEWIKVFKEWLRQNPGKTVNDIIEKETISIDGISYNIGTKTYQLRGHMRNGRKVDNRFIELGLSSEKKNIVNPDDIWIEVFKEWLKQNPGKDINEITRSVAFEYDGVLFNLGIKLQNLLKILRSGGLVDKRYLELGLISDTKHIFHSDDEWIAALKEWLRQNPDKDINDISYDTFVTVNGETFNIGRRVHYIRDKLRKKNLVDERYILLGLKKNSNGNNKTDDDEWIRIFNAWLRQNPGKDLNDIVQSDVFIFEGKKINIGYKIKNLKNRLRKKLSIDQRYIDLGLSLKFKESIEELVDDFDGDKEKARKVNDCLENLRNKKKEKKKKEYDISNILSEFDVDLDTLNIYLNRTKAIGFTKSPTTMYGDESLRNYCIKNGYNYDVVIRIVKLHKAFPNYILDKIVEIAINDYNTRGQEAPNIWVYESYGKLLKHKLLYLGLDSNTIIRNMRNYTITLEEAVRSEVYRVNCNDKKYKWLEELYDYLIDEVSFDKDEESTQKDLIDMFMILVNEYKLDKDEYGFLWDIFVKYIETMKKYQVVDVGLEDNKGKKLDKIIRYNFDEKMICDACFVPYEFEGKVLRGKDSSYYKRMMIIKEITHNWKNLTNEERNKVIKAYSINNEELGIIINKRREINSYIEKYKQVLNGRKHN